MKRTAPFQAVASVTG